MSIIDEIKKEKNWKSYLQYKKNNNLLTDKEQKYIKQNKYINIANEITNGEYTFNPPKRRLVNNAGDKRKIVYTYNEDETMILKLISFLIMQKYDDKFSPNCYSFRKDFGIKQAMENLSAASNIEKLCCYKIKIDNYYSNIPIELLLDKLKKLFSDDIKLYEFFEKILTDKRVEVDKEIIIEEKGIMLGTPIASFLGNVYLDDMDKKYYEEQTLYARYADEIIILCRENELQNNMISIENDVYRHQLSLDITKRELIAPGAMWSFSGFSHQNEIIDLSEETKKKIKNQIKKFAKEIRRRAILKEDFPEVALKTMNRKFNKIFYEEKPGKDMPWYMWFFPVINTAGSLREIDKCMQENLRYIVTGKHSKTNYKDVKYSYLKKCYYRPLVPEFLKKYKAI